MALHVVNVPTQKPQILTISAVITRITEFRISAASLAQSHRTM